MLGVYAPYLVLHYRAIGLDIAQIGLLGSLSPLFMILSGPLWGLLADALRLRRVLLPIAILGAILPLIAISQVRDFGLLLLLTCIQALFMSPVSSLSDSAVLTALGDRRDRYGAQRLWGAVGWIVASVGAGWLVTRTSLNLIFWLAPIAGSLCFIATLLMPTGTLTQVSLRSALGTFLRDRRWAGFLGAALLIGCAGALVQSFQSLYMQDRGATSELIGWALAIGSLSELPIMALSSWMLRNFGTRMLLTISGLAHVLRLVAYILVPDLGWFLAVQLFHGPCFALFWTSGVVQAQELSPKGMETTAQALFGMMFFGAAGMLMSSIGGLIYRDFGSTIMFSMGAILALFGTLIVGLTSRLPEVVPQPVAADARPAHNGSRK